MSIKDSNVEYYDTLSSGDFYGMNSKQTKEVNNNEVDALSKEFGEMGCIVDAVKRPPNICVETCVYESESDGGKEEDAYSDEFEEDQSEDETVSQPVTKKDRVASLPGQLQSSIKLSKSQSSMCSKPPHSVSGRSGKSTDFGSMSSSYPRRINMSFSNERLREIERHNHILLSKIMSARNSKKSSIPPRDSSQPVRKPIPSATLARKNQQKQIDHDNMILLRKIQRAKSSALSIRR